MSAPERKLPDISYKSRAHVAKEIERRSRRLTLASVCGGAVGGAAATYICFHAGVAATFLLGFAAVLGSFVGAFSAVKIAHRISERKALPEG